LVPRKALNEGRQRGGRLALDDLSCDHVADRICEQL